MIVFSGASGVDVQKRFAAEPERAQVDQDGVGRCVVPAESPLDVGPGLPAERMMAPPFIRGDRRAGDRLVVGVDDPAQDRVARTEPEFDRRRAREGGERLQVGRMAPRLDGQDRRAGRDAGHREPAGSVGRRLVDRLAGRGGPSPAPPGRRRSAARPRRGRGPSR